MGSGELSGEQEEGEQTGEVGESYRHERELAFFVVNFGYTKEQYAELTEKEKRFILKAYEDKTVFESNLIHDAVYIAHANINKKKGGKNTPLWKKRVTAQITEEVRESDLSIIEQTNRDDPDWAKRVIANALTGGGI